MTTTVTLFSLLLLSTTLNNNNNNNTVLLMKVSAQTFTLPDSIVGDFENVLTSMGGPPNSVGTNTDDLDGTGSGIEIGPTDWIYAYVMNNPPGNGGGGGITNGGQIVPNTPVGDGDGDGNDQGEDDEDDQDTTFTVGDNNPGVPFGDVISIRNGDELLTSIVAMAPPAQETLASIIAQTGFQITQCNLYVCYGWMPLQNYPQIKLSNQVKVVMPNMRETLTSIKTKTTVDTRRRRATRRASSFNTTKADRALQAGTVISEALQSLRVDDVRSTFSLDGSGLRIGILSDSFDTRSGASTRLIDDVNSGDLPPGIQILKDFTDGTPSDEGRAMAQLMFDLVPGATFSFYTAFESIQDFANGIEMLAQMDCDVIVDDVRALTEPAFQDGIIAQAANKVASQMNVPYFSSAGNQRDNAWEGPFRDSGIDLTLVTGGGNLIKNLGSANNFDPAGTNVIRQRIVTTGSRTTTLVLQWDDPFLTVSGPPGADSDVDILVVNAGANTVVASDFIDNRGGDAVALVSFPSGSYDVIVTVANGPFPSRLKWFAFGGNTVTSIEFDTNSSTSFGQPNQPFTAGVGASFFQDTPEFGQSPPLLEGFSSRGGQPIIFNGDGSRKSSPLIPNQPRFVATDGVKNTFFGNFDNFQPNGQGFYFFGTYITFTKGVPFRKMKSFCICLTFCFLVLCSFPLWGFHCDFDTYMFLLTIVDRV